MYKIAVLGDRESITVFSAVGFDIYETNSAKNASETLKKLASEDYGVIYITEKLAFQIKKDIEELKENVIPAVILIPGVNGNTGEGMRNLGSSVERAVGKNILK